MGKALVHGKEVAVFAIEGSVSAASVCPRPEFPWEQVHWRGRDAPPKHEVGGNTLPSGSSRPVLVFLPYIASDFYYQAVIVT